MPTRAPRWILFPALLTSAAFAGCGGAAAPTPSDAAADPLPSDGGPWRPKDGAASAPGDGALDDPSDAASDTEGGTGVDTGPVMSHPRDLPRGWTRLSDKDPLPAWPPSGIHTSTAFEAPMVLDSKRGHLMVLSPHLQGWQWEVAAGAWRPGPNFYARDLELLSGPFSYAYDSIRDRVFAHGETGSDPYAIELRELDPATDAWTVIARPAGVAANAWPRLAGQRAVAYDKARGKVVMFGGWLVDNVKKDEYLDEVWERDSATGAFTQRRRQPAGGAWPSPRYVAKLVYDDTRGRVWMFGGQGDYRDGKPLHPDDTRELWEWNGAAGTWRNLTPHPLPAAWPEAGETLLFDHARDELVLAFSRKGFAGPDVAPGVWRYKIATGVWSEAPPPAGTEIFAAGGFWGYDERGGRVLRYNPADATLWALEGTVWRNLTPAVRPRSRPEAGTMVVDEGRGRVVVATSDPDAGGTWEWDRGSRTWSYFKPSAAPNGARSTGIAYHPSLKRVVALGATPDGKQVWLYGWTGADWQPIAGSERLTWGRLFSAPGRRSLLLLEANSSAELLQLHEWTPSAKWVMRGQVQLPKAFSSSTPVAFGYDPVKDRFFVHRGREALEAGMILNATWEWDLTANTLTKAYQGRSAAISDANRGGSLVFSPRDGGMLLAGRDGHWSWDPVARTWQPLGTCARPVAMMATDPTAQRARLRSLPGRRGHLRWLLGVGRRL